LHCKGELLDNDNKDDGKEAVGNDLIIPIAALLFTLYYFSTIWGLEWEARANGMALGFILIALILLFFVRTMVRIARKQARFSFSFGGLAGRGEVLLQRLGLFGLIAAFIVALPYLGFTLTIFLFLVAAMRLLGTRSIKTLLKFALPVAIGGYLLFIVLLGTRLPYGPVEHMLAHLF
jgi:hypothetical protein